jgi:hypothetical protein
VLAHGHQTELETLFDFGGYKHAAPDGAAAEFHLGVAIGDHLRLNCRVKLFYTGPVVNAEMLVMMLEKLASPPRRRSWTPPRRTTAI